MNNQFFGTQYSQEDLQRHVAQRRASKNGASRQNSISRVQAPPQSNDDSMDMTGGGMGGGDSLDDIIMQNNKEIQRRQSMPQTYPGQDSDRRMSASMMEFSAGNGSLNDFQFGTSSGADAHRRQSTGELEMAGGYSNVGAGMQMPNSMGFSPTIQTANPLSIDTSGQFAGMSPEMMNNMMGYPPMGMDGLSAEGTTPINMFAPNNFGQSYGTGNMDSMPNELMLTGHDGLPTLPPPRVGMQGDQADNSMIQDMNITDETLIASPIMNQTQNLSRYNSPVDTHQPTNSLNREPFSMSGTAHSISASDAESTPKPEPSQPNYANIYSSSGFDMLGALMKVASRKNPEINIGKVDMSCAFVVCDITQPDCPIVYVSDIFERLTGYTKHEVLGRNCRFLQSPEGKVQSGIKRKYCDNDSVYYLKNRILEKREAQRSLINYRKGGQPFMNLLTMIPITGEDDKEIQYFVGFQVDLVEKPQSVEGKGGSGTYTVDYSQGMLPRYVWQPPGPSRPHADGGQTVSRDDVASLLTSINNSTDSELTKRMWDKVLLENTDDVVHVLSLKGLFLYLSPSSRQVLEYDSSELVGTALSSVCHPSDIVPVTRELKDTSTGMSVNIVFRIRRKKSGYTWFESHGCLCVEQGKGRKCIILVGRERPVYALNRGDIDAAGGIGESELWTKLSTSGMFLFVSSNVRTLLDRQPDDLVGTSIQSLMRSESRVEFGRSLEKARTGKRVTHKHEVLNKRGLVLQAQTTLYPGDASEGQKPTFLVAQTRLPKTSSRAVAPAIGSGGSNKPIVSFGKHDHHSEDSTPISHSSVLSASQVADVSTPRSTTSLPGPVTQAGGSGLPIGSQDVALASEDNIFDELKTTRCTSWQFELRQMEKNNRALAEELAGLLSNKKKRKRRKGAGHLQRDCANCHTRVTPEWRRGPSGQRDLCNSCGLRWAKQTGRVSPRTSNRGGDRQSRDAGSKHSVSPVHSSSLQNEVARPATATPNLNPNPNPPAPGSTEGVGGKAASAEGSAIPAPASLGGRTTQESMPIHVRSHGYREGGERGITNIDEKDES